MRTLLMWIACAGMAVSLTTATAWAQEEEEEAQTRPAPEDARPSDVDRVTIPGFGTFDRAGKLKDGRRYRLKGNRLQVRAARAKLARAAKAAKGAKGAKAARRAKAGGGWKSAGAGQVQLAGGLKLDVNAKGIIIINGKPANVKPARGGAGKEATKGAARRTPAKARGIRQKAKGGAIQR